VTPVRLYPWEREWASYVGMKRTEANAKKGDAHYYDRDRMEPDDVANVASCYAELAVAKRLNKYWSGSFWTAGDHETYRHLPDVGDNTEVRRIRKPDSPLPVRANDVKEGRMMVLAFVLDGEPIIVNVIGYGLANDLWPLGTPADYDKKGTTVLVPQHLLTAL